MTLDPKAALAKRLFFIRKSALKSTIKSLREQSSKPRKAYFSAAGSFILSIEGVRAFDQILDSLKKIDDVAEKFSNQYLEGMINQVIVELVATDERKVEAKIQEQIDHIFKTIATSPANWTIIIPIVNLKIAVEELVVGKVRFLRFEKPYTEELQSRIGETRKAIDREWLSLLNNSLKEFNCEVVAEVSIPAVDDTRAEEIGVQTLNIALDILRFFRLSYDFPQTEDAEYDFDVQGNITSAKQPLVLYSSKILSCPQRWKGLLRPFFLTDDILKVFESDGLKAVSEILKREEDITPFEKNLITSIRFCALSTRDKQMTNAFVNSIISLEALLLKMGEAKADNLAERVAFVVGQDLYERNWFFDQMRRLYGTRNSIVHSGHSDIQRSDLLLLQNILNYRCIVNLLKSYKTWKIENTSDLIRWIREQKFS